MACRFIPRAPPRALNLTLSNEELIKFLVEDHERRSSCRKKKVTESLVEIQSIARDDITLPPQEISSTEIFDFFYDPKAAEAKLDVLADLEPSIISKSASPSNQNITDRRKAKRN